MTINVDSELTGLNPGATAASQDDARPPRRELDRLGLFLDLDGTLAPIAETPGQAYIPPPTLVLLRQLYGACKGALAIVSGRDAPDIERMLSPLTLPYAALHGAHFKGPDGTVERSAINQAALADIVNTLTREAAAMPGTLLERKALSVAFHYRHAPHLAERVQASVARALAYHHRSFEAQKGKMVVEIKPKGVNKGAAITRFMAEAPFRNRTPLMAGDDLTDESAFAVVNALGGISIKVGSGPTQAHSRLPDPQALRDWLAELQTAK